MKKNGYTIVELLILIIFIVAIVLSVAGLYTIFHFVAKYW